MPSRPRRTTEDRYERTKAEERVVAAARSGQDWKLAALYNDISPTKAYRLVNVDPDAQPKKHGGVRHNCVKMTMEVICKIEEYIDEDCRVTLAAMKDRLFNDLQVRVSLSSIHRALQGMLYRLKQVRIEKATMNATENKTKRRKFVEDLNKHISNGDMIIYHDETNFNMYLSRGQGWAKVGERATTILPPSRGVNLHVQGAVSPGTGIVLMKTHEGSIKKEENARFVADLFVAALATEEYKELGPGRKIVIVTDNAPAHIQVEALAREYLLADGIVNGSKLVLLRLAPYSPMLNPIEGCWNVLKARMRKFILEYKEELLVRGEFDTLAANRMAIMKKAVDIAMPAITRNLVLRHERHCSRACFLAERGEDMALGT